MGTAGAAEPKPIVEPEPAVLDLRTNDDVPPLAGGSTPPPATMHPLTVEAVRILIRISLSHADEISPQTAESLAYCLRRMKKYARHDWHQIRDLQPLLLLLQRSNPK